MKQHIYPAIPLDAGQIQGWKDILIEENSHDPLVPLGPLSEEASELATSAIYFGEHSSSPYAEDQHKLEGSLLTVFARQSVARRLVAAEKLLPAGYHLIVFDAYRPYQVQRSLYECYKQKLSKKYPDKDATALEAETQKYVSLPSTDPARPSPHNTGGAVDVAIVGHDGTMLNFGTAFDHGGEKSALAYYESKIAAGEVLTRDDQQACNNRRLLFSVMTQAGFQPYFAEWWHFNAPESQMGAAAAGHKLASFGAIKLSGNNLAHEHTRQAVRRQALMAGSKWPAEIIAPPEE